MPKRTERRSIEHWRDGECIERYDFQMRDHPAYRGRHLLHRVSTWLH